MIADTLTNVGVAVGSVIAVVTFTAGVVAAFLGLRGDTREAIEDQADKRVDEAREQVLQLATVSREWRENFEGLDRVRHADEAKHAAEARELRNQLDETRSELAVSRAATDLSGLEERLIAREERIEERMTARFDAFLHAQEQQTEVLTALTKAVSDLNQRVNAAPATEGAAQ